MQTERRTPSFRSPSAPIDHSAVIVAFPKCKKRFAVRDFFLNRRPRSNDLPIGTAEKMRLRMTAYLRIVSVLFLQTAKGDLVCVFYR